MSCRKSWRETFACLIDFALDLVDISADRFSTSVYSHQGKPMHRPVRAAACALLVAASLVVSLHAQEPADKPAPRRPDQFAIIFIMGYAGDAFPQDKAQFETLIESVKAAGYNTVLCKYEDWRAEICRKHGIKIMVDLLVPEHHVYKNVEAAKTLCEQLKDSDVIYGYHLWSDEIGGIAPGRVRDAANVRQWDPKHPTYVGSRNARGLESVTDADLIGYYDFHWRRGGHFRHLSRASAAAKQHDSRLLEYCQGDPGLVGKGNYNRVLYTISTSIAFGLKGYMFHYTGAELDTKTWKWQPLGDDLARVNAEVAPLGPELMKLGNPSAVYSTPITRTEKNDPVEGDKPIPHPEIAAVPADFFLQVAGGEAILGVFQDDAKRDAIVFANNNAYEPQAMKLQFASPPKKVELFDRKAAKWSEVPLKDNVAEFALPPAAAELVRVER
jgi:hypothetical protein